MKIRIGWIIVSGLLVVLTLAITNVIGSKQSQPQKQEKSDMQAILQTEQSSSRLPPIDAAATDNYSTASFGLG